MLLCHNARACLSFVAVVTRAWEKEFAFWRVNTLKTELLFYLVPPAGRAILRDIYRQTELGDDFKHCDASVELRRAATKQNVCSPFLDSEQNVCSPLLDSEQNVCSPFLDSEENVYRPFLDSEEFIITLTLLFRNFNFFYFRNVHVQCFI